MIDHISKKGERKSRGQKMRINEKQRSEKLGERADWISQNLNLVFK